MARDPFRQLHVYRNASQQGRMVTDCYRLMYNKELWIRAYGNLYLTRKKCANIARIIDGYQIEEIIEQLKAGSFRLKLVKNNSCMKSKLVEKVLSILLDNIYEPIFSTHSHGFRKLKNYYTALSEIENKWSEVIWCIKGDLNKLFYDMDHTLLLQLISKKINDDRFLLLLHHVLTKGKIEKWSRHYMFPGKLHSGILSPLLANIYLHELDCFMEKQIKAFDKGINLKFVRHLDVFVIGVAGCKQGAVKTKRTIEQFLKGELYLPVRDEQLQITHLEKPVTFLGYQFRRRNTCKTEKNISKNNRSSRNKSLSYKIKLEIPQKKLRDFALSNDYGDLEEWKMKHRTKLLNDGELNILHRYNSELRDIAHYYKLAHNYHHLGKLFYLAENSFIKTIANKRKSTSRKVITHMRKHKQGVLCLVNKDERGSETLHQFVKLKDLPKPRKMIKYSTVKQ